MMILWDITSNFIRGTLAKKSKMAAKSSKLCLLCNFLKDTNITEQDNHIKQHGMFIDVILEHFKLILRKSKECFGLSQTFMPQEYSFLTFFTKECTCSFENLRKTTKYYLQFGVGSRHGTRFRKD